MQKLKDAWYRDNYFPIPFEKEEAWREVERHANFAYRYIKEELKPESPLPSNEDELLYLYDSINGGMESFENEKELQKFIIDNFTEGNEAHPDIDTLKIYKMIGEVSLNEKDELEINFFTRNTPT